jgi:hypothetical protein
VSRHHQHSERAFSATEAEVNAERAAALGRAGRRVEAAFARCEVLLAELELETADHESVTGYRAARAEFDQAMYAYLVQREAIGLVDHRAVRQTFPRPPRR